MLGPGWKLSQQRVITQAIRCAVESAFRREDNELVNFPQTAACLAATKR
jgi:hypothetical protein